MTARFLDWLLGPRCHNCQTRVFPRDAVRHYLHQCPGKLT